MSSCRKELNFPSRTVHTKDATTPIYHELGIRPTIELSITDKVRIEMDVREATALFTAEPYYRLTNDIGGEHPTFDTPQPFGTGLASTAGENGYVRSSGHITKDLSTKRFVQFLIRAINGSGSTPQHGNVRALFEFQDCGGRLFVWDPIRVYSQRSGTGLFFPVSGTLSTNGMADSRVAIELRDVTPSVEVEAAYQLADDPTDEGDWGSAVALKDGTSAFSATANGVAYASEFEDNATAFDAKRYIRFGLLCSNASGAECEGALAALMLEVK